MKIFVIYCLVFVLALPLSALAGSDGKGGQPAAFLDLNIGGRPAAMGGAYSAVAEGGIGMLYNPAGIAQSSKHSFAFSYRAMHLDRRLGYASFILPARDQASLGFHWLYAGTSSLEERDNQGNILPGDGISYNENLIGIDFAKQFGQFLLAGGKVFYVQNNIAGINSYTVGIDLGMMAKLDMRKTFLRNVFPLFRAGLVAKNLGATYKWTTTDYWRTRGQDQGAAVEENFPVNFRPGIAFEKPNAYLLAADIEFTDASVIKTHLGGEYTYRRMYSIRAGLDDMHPTFGAGLLKRFDGFAIKVDLSYLADKVDEGDDFLISFDVIF